MQNRVTNSPLFHVCWSVSLLARLLNVVDPVCASVCVCSPDNNFWTKSPLIWTLDFLVRLDTIKVRFKGQNHRLKFAVKGGKILPKWSVRPQMMAFYTALYTVYMLQWIMASLGILLSIYCDSTPCSWLCTPISGRIEAVCILYQK